MSVPLVGNVIAEKISFLAVSSFISVSALYTECVWAVLSTLLSVALLNSPVARLKSPDK